MAVRASPQVRVARARWEAAAHSVKQNYAPADPMVGFASIDSPTDGFTATSEQGFQISEALQFPGKAILQAGNAQRTAEIAQLSYEAVIRDVRTAAATLCYQLELDKTLLKRVMVTITDLERIVVRPDRAQALLLDRLGLRLPERLHPPPSLSKM